MMRKQICQLDATLHLSPIDPVLIKSGYAPVSGPDMTPVRMRRAGANGPQDVYYFPGASLKGVLRSHLERVARTLVEGSVCIPYYDQERAAGFSIPVEAERHSYGCGFLLKDTLNKADVYRLSCPACRLFGSLQFGGRFNIGDAYPLADESPRPEPRNGVGIDRFTGGSAHGVLFDQQVLVGGKFATQLRLVNFELWQLGALFLLLSDLRDDMLQIGSGRSRGLGRIHGEVAALELSYIRSPADARSGATLQGLYEREDEEARARYGFYDGQAGQRTIELPPGVPRGLRMTYDVTSLWPQWYDRLLPAVEGVLRWYKDDIRPAALAAAGREA